MIREPREERGREKQGVNNLGRRKADVSGLAGRPFQNNSTGPSQTITATSSKLDLALAHRDKLLTYQTQNAQRTTLHDQASDIDASPFATSQWASPLERARRLKQQQAVLREQEWNARPEYKKRKVVVSLEYPSASHLKFAPCRLERGLGTKPRESC